MTGELIRGKGLTEIRLSHSGPTVSVLFPLRFGALKAANNCTRQSTQYASRLP